MHLLMPHATDMYRIGLICWYNYCIASYFMHSYMTTVSQQRLFTWLFPRPLGFCLEMGKWKIKMMMMMSSHRSDFHEISYLEFSLKLVDTFWFWLKLYSNNRCLAWRLMHIHVTCLYNGNRLFPVRYKVMPEKHVMIWTSHICEPSIGNGMCHHLWDMAELVRPEKRDYLTCHLTQETKAISYYLYSAFIAFTNSGNSRKSRGNYRGNVPKVLHHANISYLLYHGSCVPLLYHIQDVMRFFLLFLSPSKQISG